MSSTTLTFDNGAAYEDFMGLWSRLVGEPFLAWLAPAQGLRWAVSAVSAYGTKLAN